MKYCITGFFIFIFSIQAFCQENENIVFENDKLNHSSSISKKTSKSLELEFQFKNESKDINDAAAQAFVSGGVPPYNYKWSDTETDTLSDISKELTESKEYFLTITDSNNDTIIGEFEIHAESPGEIINSVFVPIVFYIDKVLMADIFAMLNLYDPTIYKDNGEIAIYPNGDTRKMKVPIIVIWLVLGAIFFTIRMKFVNFRGFRHAIDLIKGKFDNPKDQGEVSHFQALATALSATVGLGNIAGVAIAISIGGPGATLWMIIAGLLGMSSKFVEVTLGVKYRTIDEDGRVSGGPMYYLNKALAKKNLGGLGKVLAAIFAVLVIGGSFGGGNMFQANQAFSQFANMIPEISEYGTYFGIIVAILVGIVIIGGIKSIAKVTEKIVPIMAILYVATSLIIIVLNISETGNAFSMIFHGAFAPNALKGGIVGVLIVGFQRAAFSNEAGVGSASIAHSAVKTEEPVSEGIVALLEPFIDTVVICTMTALVIIFTDSPENPVLSNPENLEGAQLTSAAFGSVFSWFPYVLMVAIFLFAFSTMISWSYYGQKGFNYLFGGFFEKTFGDRKYMRTTYQLIFLCFVVVGASSSLGAVIDFSDMMILSMAFPNILGLIILAPEVKRDLDSYFRRIKNGEIKKYK
ncbi:MAG: amino acid carrier protein [Bacteroidetes bacterium]|jgi:alanine or glycine:cation symporter, AGCS family|nr:amino acid carrier protein [Bacteroidota bacterium]MBT6686300.1 amino acid carrier protein [Bacteroidota bacterium]MBT7145102.1 amino acid carrier protein [Bacteroidota bacterium]MBT7490180.1 amino acid carrier protein [Bacteroidota bacterium]